MSRTGEAAYTVAVSGDARFRVVVGAVLSSLPRTYSRPSSTRSTGAAADVVALDGGTDWADAAAHAVEGGARGVVVVEPEPVPADRITRLIGVAQQATATVRLARRWAGDPTVDLFAREASGSADTTLVDTRAETPPGADGPSTVVAQIDLVQRALRGTVELESLCIREGSYVGTGRLRRGDRIDLLMMSGAGSAPLRHRATVRELLFAGRRWLEVGDGVTARAATASLGDPAGTRILTPVYETAYRAALRSLAVDLARDVGDTTDLEAYRSAVIAAETVRKGAAP